MGILLVKIFFSPIIDVICKSSFMPCLVCNPLAAAVSESSRLSGLLQNVWRPLVVIKSFLYCHCLLLLKQTLEKVFPF